MTAAFFERPGSRWFNIPAHRPFAEDLAQGLYEALAHLGPEALADAVVLTPTRRGARALADAFIKASGGKAVLPPQMRPLGDLEAGEPPFEPGDLALDPPAAIDPLRRRFELTRLVAELEAYVPGGLVSAGAALELADALGGFLDGLQIEEVAVGDRLASLVGAELAEHWEVSRGFLEKALALWPERLLALGVADVSERRVRLLRRLAEHWTEAPPRGVLVAAGSTGTAPATRALLIAVAAAPRAPWSCLAWTRTSPTRPGPRSTCSIRKARSSGCWTRRGWRRAPWRSGPRRCGRRARAGGAGGSSTRPCGPPRRPPTGCR